MKNKIPLVDLKAQYQSIKSEVDDAIERVINDTAFIMGPDVLAFEEDFARFCGAKYCIGTASGTSALQLALLACNVQPGDEIITVAHTFTATAEAIVQCQAIPVFIDIDPLTYLMAPTKIEAAITSKTKAIMPVHLYGRPAQMDLINAIAKQHGLLVIEDAAQAHGAKFKGQTVGILGDAAGFSFYPGKNLGAYGDAGAVTTDNEKVAQKVRMLRDHGRFQSKYDHQIVGFGERMDTIQAAILKAKLPHLSDWTTLRRKCAKNYFNLLRDLPVQLPGDDQNTYSVYHLFVIRLMEHRDKILSFLHSQGVGAGIHYPIPLHLQPAYEMLGYKIGDLPNTEKAAAQVLSLPIYPELEEVNQEYIYQVLLAALDAA